MDQIITDETNLVHQLVSGSAQATLSNLILSEFREYRGHDTSWKLDNTAKMGALQASVRSGLDGNGQPSRVAVLEAKVEMLQKFQWKLLGIASALGSIAAVLGWAFPRPH